MSTTEPTTISPGRAPNTVPGYRLDCLIGKGGMGEVYKGLQLSLDRPVALKFLSKSLAEDESFVARFEKEAAALAALSHPNIVSIVDKGRADSTYYLVMELIGGKPLRDVMRDEKPDALRSLRIVADICRAIEYAHGKGIIHRDLKPENILFDDQAGGIPKVTDFGLAGFLEKEDAARFNLTRDHVAMGTLSYMAPEQHLDARSADGRADIYSLGVILYELLVGDVPRGSFDPPSVKNPDVDPRTDAVVARCLKVAPLDRYQTAGALLVDLEALLPQTSSLHRERQRSTLERVRALVARTARKAAAGAAVLVVGAALLALGLAMTREPAATGWDQLGVEAIAGQLEPAADFQLPGTHVLDGAASSFVLGKGAGALELRPAGRAPGQAGEGLSFAAAADGSVGPGRALLEVGELIGESVELSAELSAPLPVAPGTPRALRVLTGMEEPAPRAAVLLHRGLDQFVAVIVPATGPVVLQWALGESRRGILLGPELVPGQGCNVSLGIDRDGELRASVEQGGEVVPIGGAVRLGPGWRGYLGNEPRPGLGCLDGLCSFGTLRYTVHLAAPESALPPPAAGGPMSELSLPPVSEPPVPAVAAAERPVEKAPVAAAAAAARAAPRKEPDTARKKKEEPRQPKAEAPRKKAAGPAKGSAPAKGATPAKSTGKKR